MTDAIKITDLSKRYGKFTALNQLNLTIEANQIVGLIGPNGAGKTSLLKAILGLMPYQGQIDILGLNPKTHRYQLMHKVCFIADVAILPRWISVQQAINYVQAMHPKFDLNKAHNLIAKTNINLKQKVRELSKGMITQLHLALILAIDVELLILDEPTIGLDIVYRQEFYQQLLDEYQNKKRTIIIATHQIEEIEPILSSIIMIKQGQVILHDAVTHLQQQYTQVYVDKTQLKQAQALNPLNQKPLPESCLMLFEAPADQVAHLGQANPAPLADIFVSKIKGNP